MNIEGLRYFVEVARTGSFYRASQRLFISQQGLNRSVTALERELGAQLLERSRKGVALTHEGEIVYRRAQGILEEHDALLGELFEATHSHTLGEGPISLAVSFYAAQTAATDPEYVRLLSNSAYIELPFEELLERALASDGSGLVYVDLNGRTLARIAADPRLSFEPVAATYVGVVSRIGSSFSVKGRVSREEVAQAPVAVCTQRETAQIQRQLFAGAPLQDIRLGTASPRMLLEAVQGSPGTLALFDSFGFFLAEKDQGVSTEGMAFTPLDCPEALCFMGFLEPRGVRLSARAEHAKRLLRQWLDAHVASYFSRYPTEQLWAQALTRIRRES